MEKSELHLPFWEHVEDLRGVLFRCVYVITAAFFLVLTFHQPIIETLLGTLSSVARSEMVNNPTDVPFTYHLPKGYRVEDHLHAASIGAESWVISPQGSLKITSEPSLALLTPYEGVTVTLKLALWSAIALSSPFCLYFFVSFLLPALHAGEKKVLVPALALSYLFMAFGVFLGWKTTIPLATKMLWDFNSNLGSNLWTLPSYFDFLTMLLAAHALMFSTVSILLVLIHYQVISGEWLRHYRRHVVVATLIFAALLTPPDIFTQLTLAGAFLLFYEGAILYSKIMR